MKGGEGGGGEEQVEGRRAMTQMQGGRRGKIKGACAGDVVDA